MLSTDQQQSRSRNTRWSKALTITGILIAVLNMVLAWTMMFSEAQKIPYGAVQGSPPTQLPGENTKQIPSPETQKKPSTASKNVTEAANEIVDKMLNAAYVGKQYQERRTTLVLGFCFALISIGFSLFVMGVEGAVNLQSTANDFGSLILKVSSPGMFCILLASGIVALGLYTPPDVDIERKEDIVRAEAEGKVNVLQAEADAKERVIEAENRAKIELIEAETSARERASNSLENTPTRP